METVAPISVAEYHRMIETGVLGEDDRVELIDGFLVTKLPMNNPHRTTLIRLYDLLKPMVPKPWILQNQCPITLSASEPEPDLCAYLPDPPESFDQRHADPSECGLVVGVSDSTLAFDRSGKLEIYSRDRIPTYWIVNIPER